MSLTDEGDAIQPVIALLVDEIKCRALLDTGAGSLYISTGLLIVLKKKSNHKRYQAHRNDDESQY